MKRTNVKGITLVSLVITTVVIGILASVATYSGISMVNSAKLTAFEVELRIMQSEVNDLFDKYRQNKTVTVDSVETNILELGEPIIGLEADTNVTAKANTALDGAEVANDETTRTDYRYYTSDLIAKLGIEGITQDFLVNIKSRKVVSYLGFKHEGERYYTLEQISSRIYNVEYNNINEGNIPAFETAINRIGEDKWKVTVSNIQFEGNINKWQVKYQLEGEEYWSSSDDFSFIIKGNGNCKVKIVNGEIESEIKNVGREAPEQWKVTTTTDSEWYSYIDLSNNKEVKVNKPNLKGQMTPIKYIGETQTGSKWANAITADGSMWVWIPRYAYKITEGYHTNTAGTIEIAFIDTNNNFLNSSDSGTLVTNPSQVTYTNGVQDQWLVHPAFTSNAENGGGFGEIQGIWVGKFETTGSYDNTTETGTLSVKPGQESLCNMSANQQYRFAKISTFGESEKINAHMAKNSEWGVAAYLGHSKYGTNAQEIAQNTTGFVTGGNNSIITIYTTNKIQSTTHNATGIYDMNGGTYEYVASYVNNGGSLLIEHGGTNVGDLYGADKVEQSTSTAYKMVYEGTGISADDYNTAQKYKGDAIYETSMHNASTTGSWFEKLAAFPIVGEGTYQSSVFMRGDWWNSGSACSFVFNCAAGGANYDRTFRLVLAY